MDPNLFIPNPCPWPFKAGHISVTFPKSQEWGKMKAYPKDLTWKMAHFLSIKVLFSGLLGCTEIS